MHPTRRFRYRIGPSFFLVNTLLSAAAVARDSNRRRQHLLGMCLIRPLLIVDVNALTGGDYSTRAIDVQRQRQPSGQMFMYQMSLQSDICCKL